MVKCILSIIILSAVSFAQNGTTAAEHLLLPVSAKELSLSNAGIADVNGVNALYYNPAGLHSNEEGITGMFSYMNLFADMGLSYTGVSANLGDYGSVSFSFKSLEVGEIEITTAEQPYGTGSNFSPSLLVNSLGYANRLSDDFRIGVSVNFIFEQILQTQATGLSFDAGFIYQNFASVTGLSAAAVVKNIGGAMQFKGDDLLITVRDTNGTRGPRVVSLQTGEDKLPFLTELGLAYEAFKMDVYGLNIYGAYTGSGLTESEYKMGAQFSYNNQFFLRAGYTQLERDNSKDRNIYGPSFGVGVHLNYLFDLKVDYAYRSMEFFESINMLTVRLGF